MDTKGINCIYLLRFKEDGQFFKIGRTSNWNSRAKSLKVGDVSEALAVVQCDDYTNQERQLHRRWARNAIRLPQSEWFFVDEENVDQLLTEVRALGVLLPQPWEPVRRSKPVQCNILESAADEDDSEALEIAECFIDNLDLEVLDTLLGCNPWVIDFDIGYPPDDTACVAFDVGVPRSYDGGGVETIIVHPSADMEGEVDFFNCNKSHLASLPKRPKTLSQLVQALWDMRSLPRQDMPPEVRKRLSATARNLDMERVTGVPASYFLTYPWALEQVEADYLKLKGRPVITGNVLTLSDIPKVRQKEASVSTSGDN